MDLKLCARPWGNFVVVKVFGELDVFTAPQLRTFLCEVLEGRGEHVILDCSEVGFMDSSGLAVLVGARKRACLTGGCLRLAMPRPLVQDQLAVAGLHKVLPTYPTVEAAAALSRESPKAQYGGTECHAAGQAGDKSKLSWLSWWVTAAFG